MAQQTIPRVVVVGAGFGGLTAAKKLAKRQVQLTVLDRKNHHTFQPLLYQVATAGLSPGEIAAPIRQILRGHPSVEILLAEVQDFDLERRLVVTPEQALPYDYLIVAAGASHAYFGHDEWEPLAPGLKTIEDALEIRRRVLLAFELAERHVAGGRGQVRLNFAVVGGDDLDLFARLACEILDRRAADQTLSRLLLYSALENHELSHRFFTNYISSYYEVLSGFIQQRIERGTFREVDPLIAARSFLGMVIYHSWVQELFGGKHYQSFNIDEVSRTIATIWLQGMLAETSPAKPAKRNPKKSRESLSHVLVATS